MHKPLSLILVIMSIDCLNKKDKDTSVLAFFIFFLTSPWIYKTLQPRNQCYTIYNMKHNTKYFP